MKNILEYLEHTVRQVPDKTAFVSENDCLTFRQLFDRAMAVGSGLLRAGLSRQPVAVLMERRAETIAVFLGIVASGCFYVPIDPQSPRKRMQLLLEKLAPAACVCSTDLLPLAQSLSQTGQLLDCGNLMNEQIDWPGLNGVRTRQIDTDLIYLVFTSGSTGTPKAVAGCHRAVIDYMEGLCQVLEFHRDTVFGNQTPLYVDACLKEIIAALKYGACTYLIPKPLFLQPVKLMEFLNSQKINTICWVASALSLVSALGTLEKVQPEYLRTVAFASEVFPIRQLRRWQAAAPKARFFNLYGPTETTGICCWYEVDREFALEQTLPIGRPLPNTDVFLLDENNRIPEPGAPGEICIRGTRLTMGYYGDWESTQRAFVQNPLNPHYPELIYRTGDVGRYNTRGELEFVCRKDNQIKHMGHRIELGEIETAATAQEEIQAACCIYESNRQWIFLYYTGDLTSGALMSRLRERLPRYLLPQRLCRLDAMPLTDNGKIDRKELKQRSEQHG